MKDCRCLSYAEKPNEDCEDPQDVQAINEAKENIGDLKLKSAKDFTVPKHLRMNAERKRAELIGLEENVHTNTQTLTYLNTQLIYSSHPVFSNILQLVPSICHT